MNEIQQSNFYFFIPVVASYAIGCGIALWFLGPVLKEQKISKSDKPWLDLGLALTGAIFILIIGRVYSAGYLIPAPGMKGLNELVWIVNNFIIYSPLFLILYFRKQSLNTTLISPVRILYKIGIGLAASISAVLLFVALRQEWSRLPEIMGNAFNFDSLSNFPAVFLEGMAIAFLYVRLQWVAGKKIALAMPSVLFAGAHIPGMMADHDPVLHIILMSIVTASICAFVLFTCFKVKDIVWLGLLHYFMDAAIKAF